MSEAICYIFTWHALADACAKCQRLNGREYRDQDIFQATLRDPVEGDIWDLDADRSLAHPHCRCQLEVQVEVDLSQDQDFVNLLSTLRGLR